MCLTDRVRHRGMRTSACAWNNWSSWIRALQEIPEVLESEKYRLIADAQVGRQLSGCALSRWMRRWSWNAE